jgi:hypothetical protein
MHGGNRLLAALLRVIPGRKRFQSKAVGHDVVTHADQRHVEIERINARAKLPCRSTAFQDRAQKVDHRKDRLAQSARTLEVPPSVQIFVIDETQLLEICPQVCPDGLR